MKQLKNYGITWKSRQRSDINLNYDDPEQKPLGNIKMYFNEVLLGDNNISQLRII